MPNTDPELQRLEGVIAREIDSYQDTVWGLLAFAHEMLWDEAARRAGDDTKFSFGRRMTTSATNAISPTQSITPDLIVQPGNDYGVVAEAKIGYTPQGEADATAYRQLRKYDDDLTGWFTADEKIRLHDVAFLVHETRRVEVGDDIDRCIADGNLAFTRDFAVIGFSRLPQVEEFIRLLRGHGQLSDQAKDEKLRRGVQVKCEFLAMKADTDVVLYDDPPPLPLLMSVLWNDTFQSMVDIQVYVERRAKKTLTLDVAPDDLARRISAQMFPFWPDNDARRPSIPRTSWIREALDAFVKMGWAKRGTDGTYQVELKERRNPYGQFVRYEAKARQQRAAETARAAQDMPLLADQIEAGDFNP